MDTQEESYPAEKRPTIESVPAGNLEAMLKGIAGFQIAVTRVETAAKLSQNRTAMDHQRIIDELAAAGSPGSLDVARELEQAKRAAAAGQPLHRRARSGPASWRAASCVDSLPRTVYEERTGGAGSSAERRREKGEPHEDRGGV